MLNLTRAIGDKDLKARYEKLTAEPEIESICFTLEDNQELYVVVACDGIRDHNDVLSDQDIGKIIRDNKEQGYGSITEAITNAAIEKGSKDNVSVIVTSSAAFTHLDDDMTLSLNINDGHAGAAASKHAGDTFQHYQNVYLKPLTKLLAPPKRASEDANDPKKENFTLNLSGSGHFNSDNNAFYIRRKNQIEDKENLAALKNSRAAFKEAYKTDDKKTG
jgi:serine/threonine protein phosphatase PrpC